LAAKEQTLHEFISVAKWRDRLRTGSIAMINSFGNLGGFCGPYLIGLIKDANGSPANALYILAGFFFLCPTLVIAVFKPRMIAVHRAAVAA
jgi:MFS transporter, ACS family, tartrate transporter